MMDFLDECTLLGAAILSAQKFEFALYGIISHLSHLPEAQKDKRYKNLTPEKFLRGSVDDLKVTLGQLVTSFGERLMISSTELTDFINDRNLIAHNYWRLSRTDAKEGEKLDHPEKFLTEFLTRCDKWASISRGLLYILMEADAKNHGRLSEINLNDQQKDDVSAYQAHVASRVDFQTGNEA